MGNWIKWDKGLARKKPVLTLASRFGRERREIAGRLMEVWERIDDMTEDGIVAGGTLDMVDEFAAIPGFARAMIDVGWLSEVSGGIEFVDYAKHNGSTERSRCQARDRQTKHSKREKTHAESVSKTPPPGVSPSPSLSVSLPSPSSLDGESERKPKVPPRMHSKAYTPQFGAAWKTYPARGRESKPKAFAEWDRAVERVCAESEGMDLPGAAAFLLVKVGEFSASPKGRGEFVPAFHRWLKDDRWTDDKAVWDRGADKGASGGSGVGKAAARRRAREAGQYTEEFGHVRTIDGSETGDRATGTDPGAAPRPASLPSFD